MATAPFINRENARELSIKANQKRWDEWRKSREVPLVPAKQEQPLQAIPLADMREELEIVNEQIAHAREVLNDETPYCPACERTALEPHHRAQLLKALDSLLDRKRILLGIPMPGSRKPAPDRPNKRQFAPEPLPVVVQPVITPDVQSPKVSSRDEPNG